MYSQTFTFDRTNRNWVANTNYVDMFLASVVAYHNALRLSRGYVFVNEILERLGLEPTYQGAIAGWDVDSQNIDVRFWVANEASGTFFIEVEAKDDIRGCLTDAPFYADSAQSNHTLESVNEELKKLLDFAFKARQFGWEDPHLGMTLKEWDERAHWALTFLT